MKHHEYPFTHAELCDAITRWGCNCGPSALAFAAKVPLQAARLAIPGFDAKRYTSPTMMKAALASLGREFDAVPARGGRLLPAWMCDERMALVRVQFTGPWSAPGMNPRWAYGYTHWVAAWAQEQPDGSSVPVVFDINSGIVARGAWEVAIVPALTSGIKRADGGWYPTHIWRLR